MIELIFLISLVLITAGIGKKIYRASNMVFSSLLEELVFSSGLGWAILSGLALYIYLLGLSSRLYFYSSVLVVLFFVFPQIKTIILDLISWIKAFLKEKRDLFTYILFAFIASYIIFEIIGALAPPIEWDELVYHLTLPKNYLNHIDISYNNQPPFVNLPQNAEMLYLFGMALRNDILAKLIHFSMGIELFALIFSFSRRYLSSKIGLLAVGIFYSIPLVNSFLSTTANNDLMVYFFEFLSIYAFLNWKDTSSKTWLGISGLMIGFSMGVKYISIVCFFFIILSIITEALVLRKRGLIYLFRSLAIFVFPAVIFSSYWYIKNIVLMGNPFWPVCYDLLGGNKLPIETSELITYNIFMKYGVKRSLLNFLILPWSAIFAPDKFGGSSLGPLFIIFLPVLLFIKEKKRVIVYFLVFSMFYLTVWFWFLSQQLRFFSSVIILLSICTAYVIEKIIFFDAKFKKIIYILLFSWFFVSLGNLIMDHKDKLRVVFGNETREAYLSRKLWFYDDMTHINNILPKDSNMLISPGFDRAYYIEPRYTCGDLVLQSHILYKRYDARGLIKRLKELDITHILIGKYFYNDRIKEEDKKYYSSLIELLDNEDLKKRYLELLYTGYFYLYKII
ncbi:MAG: glycosyltransferase family 39 protein [Candidatus Omnitrophota bacterium]